MLKAVLSISFALVAAPLAALAANQTAVGEWGGALHHGDAAWRVRLHVQTVHDGGLVATASGFPLEPSASPAHVQVDGERMNFSTPTGEFTGAWDQGRAAWVGTWKQADMSEPLALRWDADAMPTKINRASPPPVTTTGQPLPSEPPNIVAPSR